MGKKIIYIVLGFLLAIICLIGVSLYMEKHNISMTIGDTESKNNSETSCSDHFENIIIDTLSSEKLNRFINTNSSNSLYVVWTTWCGSCKTHLPYLKRFSEKNNIDLVLINADFVTSKEKINQIKKSLCLQGFSKTFVVKDMLKRQLSDDKNESIKAFLRASGINDSLMKGYPGIVLIEPMTKTSKFILPPDFEDIVNKYYSENLR